MPKLNETELKKHLKERKFAPVYVIYGEEQMYVKKYTELLSVAVAGENPSDFGYHIFGGEVNLDDFAAALQMVSFMTEYNCVCASDIFFNEMDADEQSRFAEIIKIIPQGTVLIVSMPSYNVTKKSSAFNALLKYAEKHGVVCEFAKQNQQSLEKYIAKWAGENGKFISHFNVTKIISMCGTDLNMLKNEINKICAYAKGEEITFEDIEATASVNLEANIFNLSDAVINGYGDKAFSTLDRLFSQHTEPVVMLFVMTNSFIDAYRVRIADECGVVDADCANDFGYKGRVFVLNKMRKSTSRVTTNALRKCIDILIDADTQIKTSSVNQRLLIEQVIARLLMAAQEGR